MVGYFEFFIDFLYFFQIFIFIYFLVGNYGVFERFDVEIFYVFIFEDVYNVFFVFSFFDFLFFEFEFFYIYVVVFVVVNYYFSFLYYLVIFFLGKWFEE